MRGGIVEHPDFTERDRKRLAQLQNIADEMLKKALNGQKLKRWEQCLYGFGLSAFSCIFFLPSGRGVTNWASYLFPILGFAALVLLLLVFYWRNQIHQRVEEEFLGGRYGAEHKELSSRRDVAERGKIEHL